MYVPYGVVHHLNMPSLGYLYHSPPSIITSSISPNLLPADLRPNYSRSMAEHRWKRSNQPSNLIKRDINVASRSREDHEYQAAQESNDVHEPQRQSEGGGIIAPNYPLHY